MRWQPSLCLNTAERRNLRRLAQLTTEAAGRVPRWLVIGRGNDRLAELTGDLVNLDLVAAPNVDVQGNAVQLPFQASQFDGIVAKALLEHVDDPQSVVQEMLRVLKPGGHCYVEAPFLQPFHAAPADYQRFTRPGLERLMRDFRPVDCGICVEDGPGYFGGSVPRHRGRSACLA